MSRPRVHREEWRKRIQRWKDSGLTASEFAAETGINAGTLQFWRYKLKQDDSRPAPRHTQRASSAAKILSSLVEVQPWTGASSLVDQRFEIELANGRRVLVGRDFDRDALRTLITILEAA